MPPGPLLPCGLRRPPPGSAITPLAYTRLSHAADSSTRGEARGFRTCAGDACPCCAAARGAPYRPRRAPVGFGDPPRAEARLAPVFLAAGVLAAVLVALLRSL